MKGWVVRRLAHDHRGFTVEHGHPVLAWTFEDMVRAMTKVLRLAWMHEAVEVRSGGDRDDVAAVLP